MIWVHIIVSALAALAGGLIGSWTTAFRWGRRWQELQDRVTANERRLERGDRHVDAVPVLQARLDVVIESLREIKAELREDRMRFVSREECERRHEDGGT